MARLHIDTCAIGQGWATTVLSEMMECPNVIFVESTDWKSVKEKARATQFLEFLKTVQKRYGAHRVEIAPVGDVEAHIKKIEAVDSWKKCEECDDPHVFAIVRVKSVAFVLTAEKRMDKCRAKMQGKLDQKYLSFRLINSARNYCAHKVELFKPI